MLPSAWDYLGAGCLLAAAGRLELGRLRPESLALGLLVAGLAMIAAVQLLGLSSTFRQTGLALCFGWLVWSAAKGFSGWLGRFLGSAAMVFIGKISYGIYVIQGFALFYWYWLLYSSPLPVSRICAKLGIPVSVFEGHAVTIAMEILITVVAALISYHFLETPIQSLKRHFPYTRSRPCP
jgi:peptidoglycan/LPS O-acetylase OafA/YrhL